MRVLSIGNDLEELRSVHLSQPVSRVSWNGSTLVCEFQPTGRLTRQRSKHCTAAPSKATLASAQQMLDSTTDTTHSTKPLAHCPTSPDHRSVPLLPRRFNVSLSMCNSSNCCAHDQLLRNRAHHRRSISATVHGLPGPNGASSEFRRRTRLDTGSSPRGKETNCPEGRTV